MGSTSYEAPAAPPPAPSTTDSVAEYVANMPAMYQAQLDWQPKLAAQDVAMMEQYLPQVTALTQRLQEQYAPQDAATNWSLQQQYAPLYAAQQQELQQQYEPGAYNAIQNLGNQMTPEYLSGEGAFNTASDPTLQSMQSMMTPEWMTGYRAQEAPGMNAAREKVKQQSRNAWADRGLGLSGMSAMDESQAIADFEFPYALQQEQLTQNVLAQRQGLAAQLGTTGLNAQQNAWQNYYSELGRRQNVGLSLAGRYNVPNQTQMSAGQVNIPNYQAPNVMAGYSYGGVANQQMQGYNSYMPYLSNYNNQMNMINNMPSSTQQAGMAWGQYLSSR